MGEDISTLAKICITLVIVCSIVAIIFSLLTMMKKLTNENSAKLQNGMDQIAMSQFQDYDQQVKSGTDVLSAMKIFEGQNVAIVLRTKATQQSGSTYANGFIFGVLLEGFTACTSEQAGDGACYKLNSELVKDTGESKYTRNLATSNGSFVWNLNSKPCSTSGTSTYVRSSAKFLAELIKDSTNTIVGICFTQQTN